MSRTPATIIGDKEGSSGDLVLPETRGILSSTSSSSSSQRCCSLSPFSSTSYPKGTSESHTMSEAAADEPSQLSPRVSTRRHVAQVKKKKKRGKEMEEGKLKAILGFARA